MNGYSITVEPDVTTRLKPVFTDVGPDGSPVIFYEPFGRDSPNLAVPKVHSVYGQLVKMEWRVQFETHLTIIEPDHGGVPVSVSMAAWSIGGQLSYNSTTNSYSGSAMAGSGAVPMPPNPFTPSGTPWMADGDNNRHYLEWSGVSNVFAANGYQQVGGQQAALAANWSTTPDLRRIDFRDHALDALVGAPVWIAPPDQAAEVVLGLSRHSTKRRMI